MLNSNLLMLLKAQVTAKPAPTMSFGPPNPLSAAWSPQTLPQPSFCLLNTWTNAICYGHGLTGKEVIRNTIFPPAARDHRQLAPGVSLIEWLPSFIPRMVTWLPSLPQISWCFGIKYMAFTQQAFWGLQRNNNLNSQCSSESNQTACDVASRICWGHNSSSQSLTRS